MSAALSADLFDRFFKPIYVTLGMMVHITDLYSILSV